MVRIYKYFYKLSTLNLILIGIFIPVIFTSLIGILSVLFPNAFSFGDTEDLSIKAKESILMLLSAVVLAPLVETLIQYIPVKLSMLHFSQYKYASTIAIILSATVFALLHQFGLVYVIPLFFAGFIWAFLCFLFIRRKRGSYLKLTLIHCTYNASLLAIDSFFYLIFGNSYQ